MMNFEKLVKSMQMVCKAQRYGCNSKCPFYVNSQSDCCSLSNSNPKYWNIEEMAERFKRASEVTDENIQQFTANPKEMWLK